MKKTLRLLGPLALALLPAVAPANWCAQYFNNKTLAGAAATTRLDATINNDWGNGTPAGAGLGNDNFSVRWTTTLRWDANGTFRLRTDSDDGVRVWVDGVLVINNWDDHGEESDYWDATGRVNNATSTVVVEYYEATVGAVAQLFWDRPGGGTNWVIVPDNRTTAPACGGATPTRTATRTNTRTPTPNIAFSPTVTSTPPPGGCIDAETGAEQANIVQASGGGRTYIYNNTAITTCCGQTFKDIAFSVTAAGSYRMTAWVLPASGSSDSWFVEMRNAASTAVINDSVGFGADTWDITAPTQHPAGYGVWGLDPVWGRAGGGGPAAIRTWALSAGSYTLRFYRREANVYLDCILPEYLGAGPPPTPTRTATPLPPPPPIWSGLPGSERLYGLEYIPFPDRNSGGSTLHDLSVTFSTQAANDIGRNTARWYITLQGINASLLQVETRLGPHGVTCTTGYYDPADYDTATSLNLPPRPSNLSTTYAWINTTVPPTERFDAVGDPRLVPYADVMGSPANGNDLVRGAYNWYFKDINNAGWEDYELEYVAALPEADRNRYNGQPNVDIPKLMQLWREGIMISRGVYNSLSGWSNYYIGLGGEIGGDSSNLLDDGVPMYGGPWNSTSAGYNVDEIIGTDGRGSTNVDGATMVRSSTTQWRGWPFMGELWPDDLYVSQWSSTGTLAASTWGNLNNSRQSGSSYRDTWQNQTRNDDANFVEHEFPQVKHRTQNPGPSSFMNGRESSNSFNHWDVSYDAALMADGLAMGTQYNFAMPPTFAVNRPWNLNRNDLSPEWNDQPYSGRRLNLEVYATGFYNSNTTGTSTQRASAAIRARAASIDSGGNTLLGYFVVSGLRPSTESAYNFMARFSLLTCLRTFLDAGAPTASAVTTGSPNFGRNNLGGGMAFRIAPPPLVQITEPYKGQNLEGDPSVGLRWKQRFVRWNGDRYTESYPCVDDNFPPCVASSVGGDPSLEWHDTQEIVFNLKYSMDGGSNWKSILTDDPAVTGIYMPGADSVNFSLSRWYNYTWDVSGLAPGEKKVRVEGYRKSLDLHYSYHEISIVTAP